MKICLRCGKGISGPASYCEDCDVLVATLDPQTALTAAGPPPSLLRAKVEQLPFVVWNEDQERYVKLADVLALCAESAALTAEQRITALCEAHEEQFIRAEKAEAERSRLLEQIAALTRYANNGEVIHYRGDYGEFILRQDVLDLLTGKA